jgi:hypothetical protein
MKRIIAGLALASAAALVTAAPAQAAPVDPVKALKKQYVTGHGVRFSETARTEMDGKSSGTSTSTGVFAFGKSGIVASDLRNRAKGKNADIFASLMPTRQITVGKYSYAQGGIYSEDLPEGKRWVRYPNGGVSTSYNQVLDIFDAKVLKALVSHAKSFKGGTYRGYLTVKELGALSGQKTEGKLAKIKINYVLAVNSKGLVTKVISDWTLDFGVLGKSRSTTETRYSDWGAKITVKAPPADQVIDATELGPDTEVPKDIPDGSLSSLGTK